MTYNEQIQKAVAVVEATTQPQPNIRHITLSTGVVLECMRVPVMRLQAVQEQFRYPDIPVIKDEEKSRIYQNPDHPDYIAAKAAVDQQRGMASIDAIIAFGTKLVSVPTGMQRPEDTEWIEECEAGGIQVLADKPKARYLAWVRYVAAVTNEDFEVIVESVSSSMGVSQRNITTAVANFPA